MKLSSMRFKGFVWPHNPTVYSISFARNMALHKVPFGRYRLQSLGMTRRIMRGEGAFVGEDAYRQFKALATVFYEDTPGILVHPLWDTATAWFVSLELEQEPREDYVKYRFEFWEDYGGYKTGVETAAGTPLSPPPVSPATTSTAGWVYHTVCQGETIWGIAGIYGIDLIALMALNPQIKNPSQLQVGEKIRVK